MNGIDPGKVLEQAANFDAVTYLFAVFMVLTFFGGSGALTFWMLKIALPKARREIAFMAQAGPALKELGGMRRDVSEIKEAQRDQKRAALVACEMVEKSDYARGDQYARRIRDLIEPA